MYKRNMYNYHEAMKTEVRKYLENEVNFSEYDTMQELEESLIEDESLCSRITGDSKGSYTCDPYVSEENICHNLDLLKEAVEETGKSFDLLQEGADAADVLIRGYLLSDIIDSVLPEFEERFEEARKEKENIQTRLHDKYDRSLTERLNDARKELDAQHQETAVEKQKETEKGVER